MLFLHIRIVAFIMQFKAKKILKEYKIKTFLKVLH